MSLEVKRRVHAAVLCPAADLNTVRSPGHLYSRFCFVCFTKKTDSFDILLSSLMVLLFSRTFLYLELLNNFWNLSDIILDLIHYFLMMS